MRRTPTDDPLRTIDELPDQQQRVLRFVAERFATTGTGPSVREVGDEIGWNSPSSAQYHLDQLIEGGWLARDSGTNRALRPAFDPHSGTHAEWKRPSYVRHVKALPQAFSTEPTEMLPLAPMLVDSDDAFMFKMSDSSMIDAGILKGDYVVAYAQSTAQLGDTVVAGIGDEAAAVRRLRPHGDTVALEPANADMPVVMRRADEVTIYGKVVAVLRKL